MPETAQLVAWNWVLLWCCPMALDPLKNLAYPCGTCLLGPQRMCYMPSEGTFWKTACLTQAATIPPTACRICLLTVQAWGAPLALLVGQAARWLSLQSPAVADCVCGGQQLCLHLRFVGAAGWSWLLTGIQRMVEAAPL